MPQMLSSPKAHTIQWPFNPKTAEDLDYNFDVLEQAIRRLVASANDALSANDPRLSDARDPLPHADTHETGGSDPIDALDTSVLTTGILGAARGGTGVATGLTVLDASNLTTGSLPYARVQVASPRLLGRSTAGTGDMEAVTVGSGLALSGGVLAASLTFSDLPPHAFKHDTGGSDPLTALSASILTSGSLPFARIQVASPRLLGRGTASTGDMEALTLATGLTISGGAVTVGAPFTRADTNESISGSWTFTNAVTKLQASAPQFYMWDTASTTDEKIWRWAAVSNDYYLQIFDDALSSSQVVLYLTRTGANLDLFHLYTSNVARTVWNSVGLLDHRYGLALSGVQSYSLTGDQTAWNPTGLGTAFMILVAPSVGGWLIKGITAQANGVLVTVHNNSTTTFQINHEDAAATAANRIRMHNSSSRIIAAHSTITFIYNTTVSRWIELSASS